MIQSKQVFVILTITLLTFSACSSRKHAPYPQKGYRYSGIFFGEHLSATFKHGIRDGCETAKGFYTKAHERFNNNIDYYNGWFLGRKKCRHLLKIDENGDLIR